MNKPEFPDHDGKQRLPRRFGVWIPLTILAGLILAIAAGGYSRMAMRMPSNMNSTQLAAAPPGTALNLMVKVMSIASLNQLTAQLLDKRGSDYVSSGKSVQLQLQPDTRMMMGKRTDLRPGAVLQVNAIALSGNSNHFRARSVTVLTGYVQVH